MSISQQQTQPSASYMQQNQRSTQSHQQLQQQLQAPQLQPQSQHQLQQQQAQLQQEPTPAEINLMLSSLGLGLTSNEALQLANWDLKKLAMYLVSNVCVAFILSGCSHTHTSNDTDNTFFNSTQQKKKKQTKINELFHTNIRITFSSFIHAQLTA